MVNKAIRSLFQQNGTIIKCNESKNYWKYTETAPNSGNRKAIQDGFFSWRHYKNIITWHKLDPWCGHKTKVWPNFSIAVREVIITSITDRD